MGALSGPITGAGAPIPGAPLSILPLLYYRSWVGADPLDMRQSAVRST